MLNTNEIKYICNLIRISGDLGCGIKVGSMDQMVYASELEAKLENECKA